MAPSHFLEGYSSTDFLITSLLEILLGTLNMLGTAESIRVGRVTRICNSLVGNQTTHPKYSVAGSRGLSSRCLCFFGSYICWNSHPVRASLFTSLKLKRKLNGPFNGISGSLN